MNVTGTIWCGGFGYALAAFTDNVAFNFANTEWGQFGTYVYLFLGYVAAYCITFLIGVGAMWLARKLETEEDRKKRETHEALVALRQALEKRTR